MPRRGHRGGDAEIGGHLVQVFQVQIVERDIGRARPRGCAPWRGVVFRPPGGGEGLGIDAGQGGRHLPRDGAASVDAGAEDVEDEGALIMGRRWHARSRRASQG